MWEELTNCLSNADNISRETKLGDDGFDLLAITCYKYINQAMNNAKQISTERDPKNTNIKLFFTCLDPKSYTASAAWFDKVRKNMRRYVFNRNVREGVCMDYSARPLEIETVIKIIRAYSLEGSFEAAGRKNCILCTWNGIGRPYESSLLNLDFIEWCGVQKRLYGDSFQVKISRVKTFTLGG